MGIWKHAICNETFEGWDHARVCSVSAALGYQGLELAPFTLAPRIGQVDAEKRRQVRATAEKAGLKIIGLHWLLAKTEGFQVTSPDPAVRASTASYLGELARACADLGGDLMVFGSPLQRKIPEGATREQATDWFIDTFRQVVPHLEKTGVLMLLEPLAPAESDFMQTAREGNALLDRLNHPLFGLHLDVKAMSSDEAPPADIIRRNFHRLGHFHANDANRRAPGMGDTDFLPILRALKDVQYKGYVSIEVFDYKPDPETIAREGLRYLREVEARLGGA
jgi:sugar phosphate isomerase/epimerase